MIKPVKIGLLLLLGLAVLVAAAVLLGRRAPPRKSGKSVSQETSESAFIGHSGYILRLPKGYTAVASVQGEKKTNETIYFCKKGTDPIHFLNEGLFAQLGIIRLDVQPSALGEDLNGQETLSLAVAKRLRARGDKFTIKNIQISSLRGIQITTELPNPGVEAFILGKSSLYRFTAGQVDEIYLDIINSLRDPQSE